MQFGGPKIPIEDQWKYGGYRAKVLWVDGHAERAYTIQRPRTASFASAARDGKKEKTMVFSFEQSDAVIAAIRKTQAMKSCGGPFRARVEPIEEEEVEVERDQRRSRAKLE